MSTCGYQWDTQHSTHQCTTHPAIRDDGEPWLIHTCADCALVRIDRPERSRPRCDAELPHPSGHPYECAGDPNTEHQHHVDLYTDHGPIGIRRLEWATERQDTYA